MQLLDDRYAPVEDLKAAIAARTKTVRYPMIETEREQSDLLYLVNNDVDTLKKNYIINCDPVDAPNLDQWLQFRENTGLRCTLMDMGEGRFKADIGKEDEKPLISEVFDDLAEMVEQTLPLMKMMVPKINNPLDLANSAMQTLDKKIKIEAPKPKFGK